MVLKFGAKEQLVGIFLVITLFILTGAIVFIAQGKNWFKKHEQYHTFFKEGYNLSPGANVTLYHTKIGKVVKVRLTEDNRVRVDLKILAKYAYYSTLSSTCRTCKGDELFLWIIVKVFKTFKRRCLFSIQLEWNINLEPILKGILILQLRRWSLCLGRSYWFYKCFTTLRIYTWISCKGI